MNPGEPGDILKGGGTTERCAVSVDGASLSKVEETGLVEAHRMSQCKSPIRGSLWFYTIESKNLLSALSWKK